MSKPATPHKSVRIAEFKAHLSECLREVERGHPLTVLDRERPIARVIPYKDSAALTITRGKGNLREIALPDSAARARKVSSLDVLLKDRRSGR